MFYWFGAAINLIDKMNDDILMMLVGFLLIVSTLFLWLWFSNRRKYHNLKHAIPANVVKSYLDTIIQNSTALKSQLFRGGGLDIEGIPSVMPTQNLVGGEGLAISGAPSTALLEELNQKKAQIAALEAQLSALRNSNQELDKKFGQTQNVVAESKEKIRELEARLGQSVEAGGGDALLVSELERTKQERDDLSDRLKEFEIIADDLANLKRLKQENEQLKRSLAAQGGGSLENNNEDMVVDQVVASKDFEDLGQSKGQQESDKILEDFLSTPADESESENAQVDEEPTLPEETSSSEEETLVTASGEEGENPEKNDRPRSEKTPEDLLSEFEKMLG